MPKISEDLKLNLEQDHLVVATALDGQVRLVGLDATEAVRHLVKIHDMSPLVAQVSGRLVLANLLMAAGLKGEQASLTLQLKCHGQLKGLSTTADGEGNFRAYPYQAQVENFYTEKNKLDLAAGMGQGTLTVIRDLGLREAYTGQVELQEGGDIAGTVAYYLAKSEQVRSVLFLSVSLNQEGIYKAGALLVQALPNLTEENLDYLEQRAFGGFPEISYLLEEGFKPAQFMDMFMGDPNILYLEERPVQFHCPCSRDRMFRNLMTIGKKDLQELADIPEGIQLECHYCNKKYKITQEEVQNLLSDIEAK